MYSAKLLHKNKVNRLLGNLPPIDVLKKLPKNILQNTGKWWSPNNTGDVRTKNAKYAGKSQQILPG